MLKQLLVCVLCISSLFAYSKGKKGISDKKKPSTEQSTPTKKESDYDKLFKETHEVHTGAITLHKIKYKLYFEFPLSLLEKDMLLGSTVSEISDNGDAIVGSKPTEPMHIQFSKIGNRVNIIFVSKDYITNSNNKHLIEAIDKSSAGAIIQSFEIKAWNNDSTAIVFDVTDFFVSDNKKMTPFDKYSENTYGGRVSRSEIFQSGSSFLGEVKSFENNLIIRSHLSYKYSLSYKGRDLAKDVPFTAIMTRSIILLDETPYRARITDSRMPVFPIGKVVLNDKEQGVDVVYFANRWRLEPSDEEAFKKGKKVEPKKPIVFYIDNAFPQMWKKYIAEGVGQWNELFEEIGFKNAVVVKPFPTDDPEFDPDNIKYSCVRYAPIGIQNAMGPSWVDPRSGEIINASVYLYHDAIKLINNWRFIQTAQTDSEVRSVVHPEAVIGDGLRYVVAHEIGHCLGLMHNMSGSAVIPVDSLRSPTFTQRYGTTTSIMDYARFNYVAQPGDKERGVKLTPPRFGVYDKFSIKWTYSPIFEAKDALDEYKITSKWITDASADPTYRYGKQQFGSNFDPRSQNEDLGDDAVKASKYGIKNLQYILGNLNAWTDKDDKDYSYRTEIYTGIVYQYLTYISHVFTNVGGIYLNEKLSTDPVEAYKSVPREKQREALMFLCDQIKELEWLDNKELLQNIPLVGSAKKTLQTAMLRAIVVAPIKLDISSQLSKDAYHPQECMKDIYNYIWGPTMKNKPLTEIEMMMQREYMVVIGTMAGLGYKGTGAVPSNNSIVDTQSTINDLAIQTPDFLKKYARMNRNICYDCDALHEEDPIDRLFASPVAGYASANIMFVVPRIFEADNYAYLLKVQKLLKSKITISSGQTKNHYELILRNIERTLK